MKKHFKILIACVVLIAIGYGIYWILFSDFLYIGGIFTPRPKIEIQLDKTEYGVGEKVKAAVNYQGMLFISSYLKWTVQKKINNSWIDVAEEWSCPYIPDCNEINFNKNECWEMNCSRSNLVVLNNPNRRSEPGFEWTWNGRTDNERKDYVCGDENSKRDQECVIFKDADSGIYKIKFRYAIKLRRRLFPITGTVKHLDWEVVADPSWQYAEKEFIIK